jgi:hypothetical protein
MATAARIDSQFDTTEVPRIVRGAILLGLIQAICVLVVSIVNKRLEGTLDHTLTGLVVALGAAVTIFWPGMQTRPRTIEGIAGAAGIGLGATWVFLGLDAMVLQPLHTYTNRWAEIGGFSNWWYLPVWWMVGTYLSWLGGWILANQASRSGSTSLPSAIGLVALLTGACGALATALHFPGAGWNVPTFAVAVLPALAIGTLISGLGGKHA